MEKNYPCRQYTIKPKKYKVKHHDCGTSLSNLSENFLSIGTWVKVKSKASTTLKPSLFHKKEGIALVSGYIIPTNKIGQIVGGTYISLGYLEPNIYQNGFKGHFNIKEKYFVYLVRFGFINKPIKVRPEHLEVCKDQNYNMYFKSDKNKYLKGEGD